ncbi:hypothetical protein Dda_7308 [Drechslerella dactyloides]|uniref:Uncharacterized protein n=1 Tax=Drechslerella dactyloides TaxID=74499 RepID=A0AAD6IRY1_DREDA|nr:hypothetical protein Dda_7308 [Drechslerella dactyloides]
MKLDSRPGVLSFKVLDAGQQEIRPPLTPATEVDLQKSCAILVQSTTYSRSFRDATHKATARHNGAVAVRGGGGPPSAQRRTPSKSGARTPVGRVSKAHRRASSNVRFEKTATSKYVPPRRPAPEKTLPATAGWHARKVKDEKKKPPMDSLDETQETKPASDPPVSAAATTAVAPERSPRRKSLDIKKSLDIRSSDNSSGGEDTEKSRIGVKKLVVNMHHAVTGYIRPVDLVTSPQAAESQSSPTRNNRSSSEQPASAEKSKHTGEALKVRASRRRDGTTYVEALPEFMHATLDEERRSYDPKTSVSKRLGHAVKGYVKPPYVDRFTPQPLPPSSVPRRTESKKYKVTRAMKEYVRPSPVDVATTAMDVDISPVRVEKPLKPSNSKREKPPADRPSPPKESPKPSPTQAVAAPKAKLTAAPTTHHNPFRKIHDYVKPATVAAAAATEQPVVARSTSKSGRRPLTPQSSQPPSLSYVPPKIRPRGNTLPSSDPPSSSDAPSRPGPIFGGGYPVKTDDGAGKDKENANRGPASPGFFGRNPGGSGFRIHFSHLLHKQRSDGYDQLE